MEQQPAHATRHLLVQARALIEGNPGASERQGWRVDRLVAEHRSTRGEVQRSLLAWSDPALN